MRATGRFRLSSDKNHAAVSLHCMKRLKILGLVVGGLALVVVVVLVLAFTPAVQTWAVRKAGAGQPGRTIEVSRVDAGLSAAAVSDFRFTQDGMIVTVKGVSAKYSAWDYLKSGRINAANVDVQDLVVDMRNVTSAATPATAKNPAPQSSATAAKPTPFDGLLKQLQLPFDVNVGTVAVKGRALLPNDQTVGFNLKAARIETGQRGNLEWTVDFADTKVGAALKTLRTTGTLGVHIAPDRRIDLIEIEGNAAAVGPKIPDDQFRLNLKAEQPAFDWKSYGFQEFSEFLNYAQDKMLVRVEPQGETGLLVHLGPEFHPPAVPEPAPEPVVDEEQPEEDEPQPLVAGQPTARSPKPKRSPRKKATDGDGDAPPSRPRRAPRKKPAE